MTAGAVAAIRSLNSVEQSDVQADNALLGLLGSLGKAALTDFASAPDHWFITNANSAFAIAAAGVGPIKDDIDLACDALDAAEPLLQQIELLLGIELDPHDLQSRAQTMQGFSNAQVAQINYADVTIWIALQPSAQQAAHWQDIAAGLPVNLSTAPAQIALTLTAARLTLEQAADIAPGDLLILARNIAALIVPTDNVQIGNVEGWFDCNNGIFNTGRAYDDGYGDVNMTDDAELSKTPAATFSVPITLRLPAQFIDVATLQALAPGYVLPLSPLVQGLQVELLVGGQQIARGEIVEMGDIFAVHIDERASPVTAQSAPIFIAEDSE